MLFATLGEGNEGRLRDRDAWDRCRTQQFAYYLDNFTFRGLLPGRHAQDQYDRRRQCGLGLVLAPAIPTAPGSYGLNGWTPAYDGGEGTGPRPAPAKSLEEHLQPEHQQRAGPARLRPVAGYPTHYDTPPLTQDEAATNPNVSLTNSMRPFCIPRHGEFLHGVFMDWSVRKLGLKELWTLAWSPDFNVIGPWTRAGGVQPRRMAPWMTPAQRNLLNRRSGPPVCSVPVRA